MRVSWGSPRLGSVILWELVRMRSASWEVDLGDAETSQISQYRGKVSKSSTGIHPMRRGQLVQGESKLGLGNSGLLQLVAAGSWVQGVLPTPSPASSLIWGVRL